MEKEENSVQGCQSLLYLHTEKEQKILHFHAYSDALISSGLAALLIFLYSGESAEQIIQNPPKVLEKIGIPLALTPSRANGLASLYVKMRKEAIYVMLSCKEAPPGGG